MNIITLATTVDNTPQPGTIYRDDDDGELYILGRLGPEIYALISLEDGNRYTDPCNDIKLAVGDLTFISNNNKITIEPQ